MTDITPQMLHRVAQDALGIKEAYMANKHVWIPGGPEFDPRADAGQDRLLENWLLDNGYWIGITGDGFTLSDGNQVVFEMEAPRNEFRVLAVNAVLEADDAG